MLMDTCELFSPHNISRYPNVSISLSLSLIDIQDAEHIRENLLTQPSLPTHEPPSPPHGKGRMGLHTGGCWSSYRPKFICPRRTCRHSIKPFYAPEINEYDILKDQTWLVRPLPERVPALKEAFRRERHSWTPPLSARLRTLEGDHALITALSRNPESLSDEDREALPWILPEFWWMDIRKRCPGCGQDAVPVGSNFRIPARKDEKGWRQVEAWIDAGEDLQAKFVLCWTVEQHEKMVKKALEIRAGREFPVPKRIPAQSCGIQNWSWPWI